MSDLQDIGASLGFTPWSEADGDLAVRLDGLISGANSLTAEDAVIRTNEDVLFVIAHISYRRQVGDNNHVTVRETVVLLQWPGLSFPHLLIQPRGFAGWLVEKAMSMGGLTEIDFTGHEAYDKVYSTFTFQPDAVRGLMNEELLTYLTERQGLKAQTADDRVLVCRPGRLLAGDELTALIDDAQGLLSRLAESTRRIIDAGWDPQQAKSQLAEKVGGVMGGVLRARIVTRQQAEDFAALPAPREIPSTINKSFLAVTGCLTKGLSFMAAISALIVAASGMVASTVGQGLLAVMAIMAIPALGFVGILIALHYARKSHARRKHVLIHGEAVPALIRSVSRTSLTVNNQQRFMVELDYEAAGASRRKSLGAYGQAVQLAQSLLQSGEGTQALVDPEKPDEPIWIGQLVNWAS